MISKRTTPGNNFEAFSHGVARKMQIMEEGVHMKYVRPVAMAALLVLSLAGCSEPLTTREKGAALGTFGGAGLGAIIGSATGHAGAGAGIGAALGLVGGALIGDQLQARDKREAEQQRQMQATQAELERQRRELEQLKKQQER